MLSTGSRLTGVAQKEQWITSRDVRFPGQKWGQPGLLDSRKGSLGNRKILSSIIPLLASGLHTAHVCGAWLYVRLVAAPPTNPNAINNCVSNEGTGSWVWIKPAGRPVLGFSRIQTSKLQVASGNTTLRAYLVSFGRTALFFRAGLALGVLWVNILVRRTSVCLILCVNLISSRELFLTSMTQVLFRSVLCLNRWMDSRCAAQSAAKGTWEGNALIRAMLYLFSYKNNKSS